MMISIASIIIIIENFSVMIFRGALLGRILLVVVVVVVVVAGIIVHFVRPSRGRFYLTSVCKQQQQQQQMAALC